MDSKTLLSNESRASKQKKSKQIDLNKYIVKQLFYKNINPFSFLCSN